MSGALQKPVYHGKKLHIVKLLNQMIVLMWHEVNGDIIYTFMHGGRIELTVLTVKSFPDMTEYFLKYITISFANCQPALAALMPANSIFQFHLNSDDLNVAQLVILCSLYMFDS